METVTKEYLLLPETCDLIAEDVMDFCAGSRVEKRDAIICRLSVEDCLMNWIDHGLKEKTVIVRMGLRMFTPYVILEVEGKRINPLEQQDDAYNDYFQSIQLSILQRAEFSYKSGCNLLYFRLKRRNLNQFVTMGIVLFIAVVTGVLGMYLPDGIRNKLLSGLVEPLYDAFFRIIKGVAGPMVFLSVTWGIFGIGDPDTLGRVGRKLIRRYMRTGVLAALGAMVFFPIMCDGFSKASGSQNTFDDIMDMIFGIVPPSFFEPFVTGNTLQIIFLASIIGIALLFLGKRTSSIVRGMEQLFLVVNYLMSIVGKMVPILIFLVVLNMVWSETLLTLVSIWKFLVIYFIAIFAIFIIFLTVTCVRQKASPKVLIKKLLPAFLIAHSTASSSAAFGTSSENCNKKMGIDESLVNFGLPLGMVMHRPVLIMYYSLVIYYFAGIYDVPCTPVWLITGALISIVLAVASPPVAGGGTVIYSMLFAQMGIPAEAVATALVIDLITDFSATAFEVGVLPMTLIGVSSQMSMLDKDILKKEEF